MNGTNNSRSNSIKATEDLPDDPVQEQQQIQLSEQSDSQGQTNPQDTIPAVIPESQHEQEENAQEGSHISNNSNPLFDPIDKDAIPQEATVTLTSEHDNSLNQPPASSENNTHRKSIYQIIEEENEYNYDEDGEAQDNPYNDNPEMAQLKREFGDILQELQYLDTYFLELPSKMGHTLEHMRAVLDRRYQAMLKGFNNTHLKITELTAKLANIEYKISNNPGNKSLMRECAIYSEFARVLSVDLQVLSDCIISEDKTLKNIHQLYLQQHNTLLETNTNNLYTATLITRLKKYLKRYSQYYNNSNNQGLNDHQNLNHNKHNNGNNNSHFNSAHLQSIERLCGASKLRIRNHSTLFVLKNYQKPASRSTQVEFEKDKGSGVSPGQPQQQQAQTSQQFYSVQGKNQDEKREMGKTASTTATSGLPFKRNKELQKIRISVKQQGNRHFERAISSNNTNQELKQTYFSQTDTLFMKKESIQLKQEDQNKQRLQHDKIQDDFDDNYEDIDNNNNHYNHEIDAYVNANNNNNNNNNNNTKNIDFTVGPSQAWKKQLEETESAVRSLKQQNQQIKTKLLGKVNSFYSSFELLKECLGSYQSYLEQSQRVVNSKHGLVGSLLFEISKLNVTQSKPVLHAFSQQSYKPSNLMDREARMIVYDTLKNMLDKQLNTMSNSSSNRNSSLKGNSKKSNISTSNGGIPSITKNVFQSFTPLQVIGIMTLKPSSFEDVKFIMERKARILQDKATKIQALSMSSSSNTNNPQSMYDGVQMMNE